MAESKQWKTDSLEGLSKNSKVWYRDQDDDYLFGTILAMDDPSRIRVQLEGPHGQLVVQEVTAEELKPANPAILEGVEDLTHLSYLNEPSILHNLRARHTSNNIYTTAGPVLIAVNPYKRLPLYGPDMVAKFRGSKCKEPHPYAVADATFAAMLADRRNQSVVISGESGAGKTETTKIVMQYLAGLAGGTGIEDRVLQTNPILEGFGNAKTLRNNNSSRFGKLIQIYFNGRTIAGALMSTYLLEKSRVVKQAEGERSYHIFYQLVAGATASERQAWQLPSTPTEFRYLSSSGCTAIEGVDDAKDFQDMKAAMSQVGISEEEQISIFRLVASVLWLGNISFEEQLDETVRVVEDAALEKAANLLQCNVSQLSKALTGRQIQAGRESIWQELRIDQAQDTRDALAKALYSALFDWLVQRINDSLGDASKLQKALSINILDIYGFEHFKVNSFEQLCINFANERLQQQFNKYLFKLEQEEYAREGIDWAHVDFEDNQECVDLIEQKMPKGVGILSLLDEECVFPKATDETYAEKLAANLASHPNFSFKSHINNEFTIHHYAGAVTYNTSGFLDKNKDAVSLDLLNVLGGSTMSLLAELARKMTERQTAKNSMTVGSFFRDQLRLLVQTLESTQLHFVRCIKPNPQQAPLLLDNGLVLAQLRCCGVLEVVRIARAGYPTRYLHQTFADRYHILMPGSAGLGGGYSGPALDVCHKILRQFQIDPAMYQVGRTKLFFRAGLLGRMEDTWERMVHGAGTIQAFMKMAVVRSRFLRLRSAAIYAQSHRKGILQRRAFAELVRQNNASKVVAALWKAYLVRRHFKYTVACIWRIQMAYKRWCLARRVAVRRDVRLKQEAKQQAAEAERKKEAARWDRVRDDFGGDWETIRSTMAWAQQIKATYGSEQDIERLLALKSSGAPTEPPAVAFAAPPVAQNGQVPVVSEELLAELQSLRSDREALIDELQVERGRREEYEEKLEVAEEQWMAQMASLQEVLANVKRELTGGHDAAATVSVFAGDLEKFQDQLPAHHIAANGTASSGRLQSRKPYSNGNDRVKNEKSEEVMAAMHAINRLQEDFDMRTQVYDDDVDFIREVREGRTEAPDMDPVHELRQLALRFEAWKRDFKHRLHAAKHLLRKDKMDYSTSISYASPDTTLDASDILDTEVQSRNPSISEPNSSRPPRLPTGWSPPSHPPPPTHKPSVPSVKPQSYESDSSAYSQYIPAEMASPGFTVTAGDDNAPDDASEKKKKKKGIGNMLGFGRRTSK